MKLVLSILIFSFFSSSAYSTEINISPENPLVILADTIAANENGNQIILSGPWTRIKIDFTDVGEEKLIISSVEFRVTDPINGIVNKAETYGIHDDFNGQHITIHTMTFTDHIVPYKGKDFLITATLGGWYEKDGKIVRNFFEEKKFTATASY